MTRRLLILGGTGEAAKLATSAIDTFGDDLDVISSLAGRVSKPRPLPGRVRTGGFGGSDGLAQYIKTEKIDLLVDATHPFATTISANARTTCQKTGIPHLILHRPAWPALPGANIVRVENFAAAATAVSRIGTRAFLSFGHRGLDSFSSLAGVHFLVRVIDPPKAPLPIWGATVVTGRPPFSLAGEKALLKQHAIDVLVTKNSGGATVPAKIDAAIHAEIPIVLIARPASEPGDQATSIQDAVGWISDRLRP